VAVVEKGTTPEQRVVTGTLGDITTRARDQGIRPPTLVIVGEVVKLQSRLAWFEPESSLSPEPRQGSQAS
jgi:uroporphyrin-III C-methyltransferase/precorrin-2 dehydrogenase/sirohydrochlorin ferrochelatase